MIQFYETYDYTTQLADALMNYQILFTESPGAGLYSLGIMWEVERPLLARHLFEQSSIIYPDNESVIEKIKEMRRVHPITEEEEED